MAAKPRKSAVQNMIKNLLEMEIPEIQNASKELAEWIKQLEQHSFKLQHYATEIESWASEEEEIDSIELTDLIKDLEATLTDMRQARVDGVPTIEELEEVEESPDKMMRGYYKSGRVLREPKVLPRAEFKVVEKTSSVKEVVTPKAAMAEPKLEPAKATESPVMIRDTEKPRVKPEIHGGEEEIAKPEASAESKETIKTETKKTAPEEPDSKGYMTPEGFLIRRLRP